MPELNERIGSLEAVAISVGTFGALILVWKISRSIFYSTVGESRTGESMALGGHQSNRVVSAQNESDRYWAERENRDF